MNRFWFVPKTFGYGATPVTWEGWAVLAIFLAVVFGSVAVIVRNQRRKSFSLRPVAAIAIAVVLLVVVAQAKTDGEWRWSWGAAQVENSNAIR